MLVAASLSPAGVSHATRAGCRADPRPPLRPDIRQSIGRIIHNAKAVIARDARNPTSPLAHVLGGSAYRYEETGYISNGEPGFHRTFRVIGGLMDIRIDRPHPVDALVPAWGRPWPRHSRRFRFSRHFGYVPYTARFTSTEPVVDLMVDVDMRIRRVIAIEPGRNSNGTLTPLPGHCPLRPEPPED